MGTDEFRQLLHSEQDRLGAIRADLRSANDLDTDASRQELSVVDQHNADVATDQQQREVDLSVLEQVEAELSDVERAMRKLDDGTYGKCEICNEQIDAERLEAQPATRACTKHAA